MHEILLWNNTCSRYSFGVGKWVGAKGKQFILKEFFPLFLWPGVEFTLLSVLPYLNHIIQNVLLYFTLCNRFNFILIFVGWGWLFDGCKDLEIFCRQCSKPPELYCMLSMNVVLVTSMLWPVSTQSNSSKSTSRWLTAVPTNEWPSFFGGNQKCLKCRDLQSKRTWQSNPTNPHHFAWLMPQYIHMYYCWLQRLLARNVQFTSSNSRSI